MNTCTYTRTWYSASQRNARVRVWGHGPHNTMSQTVVRVCTIGFFIGEQKKGRKLEDCLEKTLNL